MSIMIRIAVNNDPPLAIVAATRATNTGIGLPHEDLVSSYEVQVLQRDPTGGLQLAGETTVDHRYGDGALALARAAFDAVVFDPVSTS